MYMDRRILNLACKYPFSSYSKEVLSSEKSIGVELKYLELAKKRIELDIVESDKTERERERGKKRYYNINMDSIKLDGVKSYVYSLMIVSVISNPIITEKFCRGEAIHSRRAFEEDSDENIIEIAKELEIKLVENEEGEFLIDFDDFLKNPLSKEEYRLVNNMINRGIVILDKSKLIDVLSESVYNYVKKGLSISIKRIPKVIVDYSKKSNITVRIKINKSISGKSMGWIEELLGIPITDARHRTVNLIFAPYFTNVKGMDPEQAYVIIKKYIDECKKINPDTKINDTYIMYQCKYSKTHKLRPLSFRRAKSLLLGLVEFKSNNKGDSNRNNNNL